MFARLSILTYGVVSYVLFLRVFLYAIGFIGGFLTPTMLDGPCNGSLGEALLIDLCLLALFALQHSGMARPGFKHWLTRFVPRSAERSTYVLASNLALIVLFWQWRPLGGMIWEVTGTGAYSLYFLFGLGWLTVLFSTFLINHFDLFGLRQVWLFFRGQSYTALPFKTPGLYRYVRHPLYVGWIMVFWFTPTMTAAHLLFALGTTAYILVAIFFEERDLVTFHPEYAAYRRRVPMFIPRFWSA
jgi:protein-S-isoprenylcysteine O-methyltransferase Ste14